MNNRIKLRVTPLNRRKWEHIAIKRIAVLLALSVAVALGFSQPSSASFGTTAGRTFKATFNSYLPRGGAAIPSQFAKPGSKVRVCRASKCVTVKAWAGSCRCFDLSDEDFRTLNHGSLAAGIITVTATKVGR